MTTNLEVELWVKVNYDLKCPQFLKRITTNYEMLANQMLNTRSYSQKYYKHIIFTKKIRNRIEKIQILDTFIFFVQIWME